MESGLCCPWDDDSGSGIHPLLLMEIETGKFSQEDVSGRGLVTNCDVGEQMTYWLAQVISINNDFLTVTNGVLGYLPSDGSGSGTFNGCEYDTDIAVFES